MLKLIKPTNTLIAISACAFLNANAQDAEVLNDVKPALEKEDFDEEQMRIATLIHKKITETQKADKKKTFAAYQDTTKKGVKIDMVPIKGGTFTWKGEKAEDVLEVTLSPFWMQKTEVTWEEYEPFMLNKLPRQKDGTVPDFMHEKIKEVDFLARPTPPYHPMTFGMQRDGHPALSMTQHAANKYCQWLSYQTGHFYRLPTEAEWEYACRAGSKTKFSWGDDKAKASEYAWLDGKLESHYQKPGQKKPNAWGLYDMHGNVLEWTLDQYVPNRQEYFGKKKVHNPWVKATKPYPHVTKGGHWKLKLADIAASARHQSDAKWKQSDPQNPRSQWYHSDTPFLGFRIVRPAKVPSVEEMYNYWNSGVAEDE